MKLPAFIEKQIVKLALSKAGPLVQKGVTLGAAAAVSYFAQKLPGVENFITPELLTGLAWLAIDAAYQALPAAVIKDYGKEIQAVLNDRGADLREDGFVGPVTVEAAKDVQ
jgi:hypothetical protein